MESKKYKIGILAYGSLIDAPGTEIEEVELNRISCITPFEVEYARSSSRRDGAPTLIPVNQGGSKVRAVIIVLNSGVALQEAKNMLYRRETGKQDDYVHKDNPVVNKVVIKEIPNFENIETVLYTSIGSNIANITDLLLAKYAVESLKKESGKKKKDGVHYLLNAINNGILTPLTEEYKKSILALTNCSSLDEVILKRNELIEN